MSPFEKKIKYTIFTQVVDLLFLSFISLSVLPPNPCKEKPLLLSPMF